MPWAGQECQKQPSMKRASFSLGKTKSGRPKSLEFLRQQVMRSWRKMVMRRSSLTFLPVQMPNIWSKQRDPSHQPLHRPQEYLCIRSRASFGGEFDVTKPVLHDLRRHKFLYRLRLIQTSCEVAQFGSRNFEPHDLFSFVYSVHVRSWCSSAMRMKGRAFATFFLETIDTCRFFISRSFSFADFMKSSLNMVSIIFGYNCREISAMIRS